MSQPDVDLLVVPCDDLDAAIATASEAGYRLAAIGPADEPTWAELERNGHRLIVDTDAGPGRRISLRPGNGQASSGPVVPETCPVGVVSHEAGGEWKAGRAGMRYRDLIPDRYGGAYIGSHIHVPDGGPVPDYVHHHDIVHQFIYCHRGWVTVVYQDQGPALTMRPGDCVLQPPGIRHRVLESSDDLYVIEVGCPAEHRTSVDHDLALPNPEIDRQRRFGGQSFVHHVAADATWHADPSLGAEGTYQDTGLADATDELVSVRRLRAHPLATDLTNNDDLRLIVVTEGSATLTGPDGTVELVEGSSATIPPSLPYRLDGADDGTVVLDIRAATPPRS